MKGWKQGLPAGPAPPTCPALEFLSFPTPFLLIPTPFPPRSLKLPQDDSLRATSFLSSMKVLTA